MLKNKKLLLSPLLLFQQNQMEIIKSFIYFSLKLSKHNKITFLITQPKKYKILNELGYIDLFKKTNIKIIFEPNSLKLDNNIVKADNNYLDNITDNDFDYIFLLSNTVTSWNDSLENSSNKFKIWFNDIYTNKQTQIKFNIAKYHTKNTYLFYYLNRKYNIPVGYYIVDWKEVPLSLIYEGKIQSFSMYNNDKYKYSVKHIPIYEQYLFRGKIRTNKIYDFVFGYSKPKGKPRKELAKQIDKIKRTNKIIILERNPDKGVNTLVDQTEYLNKYIAHSKFSLIVPSMDEDEFSIMRLWECLSKNCIPLISKECNIKRAFKGKKSLVEFYKRNNLFIDLNKENINKKLKKLDYDKIFKDLKQVKYYKKLINNKIHEKEINEILNKEIEGNGK